MTGILLVHGAWHGPWCSDGAAERLTRHGHQVEAVRLRGHDQPPGRIWHRVHHYLQDVHEAAARFIDTVLVWPRPRRVQVPVLVMGAERDGFFTAAEMRRTAAAYQTQAEIVPGMGHDLMLDQDWPQVADRIDTWVRETAPLGATAAGRARAAILRFLGDSIGENARSREMPWVEPAADD
jgi:alpha-beta hydrolase superfamily lysophospholipase